MKKPERRGRAKAAAIHFDLNNARHRAYLHVRALQLDDKELAYLKEIISGECERRETLRKKKRVTFGPSDKLTKAVWL